MTRYQVRIDRIDGRVFTNSWDVSEQLARELLWEGVLRATADLDESAQDGVFKVHVRQVRTP